MSDPVKLALITLFGSLITVAGGIVSAWIGYLVIKSKVAKAFDTEAPKLVEPLTSAVETGNTLQRQAAVEVRDVKATLVESTDRQAETLGQLVKTANDTHVLVNSQYGAALQLTATTARVLADTTGKPEHLLLAANAEKAVADHMARQAVVDAGRSAEGRP